MPHYLFDAFSPTGDDGDESAGEKRWSLVENEERNKGNLGDNPIKQILSSKKTKLVLKVLMVRYLNLDHNNAKI